jgi:hypothetical protein
VFSALFMDDINEDVSDVVQKVDDVIDYLTIKDVLLGEKKVEFQIERPAEEDDGDTLFRYSDDENYINEPEPDYGTDEKKADDCDSRTSLPGNVENDATDIAHAGKQDGVDETIMPEMDIDTAEIYANIQTSVKLLRLRGITLAAIREFIDKQEPLSPLVITEDLRLFLPLYNNIEIELSAQKKALYFLFLNHPEGIVLQHLEEYHNELVNYYKQSNKGVLTPKMEESIKKLEAYGNNQLNVLIARIREAFCLKFDEHLARNYFISGEKGQPYRIPLDPGLIEWKE